MDRMRHTYVRQDSSTSSNGTPSGSMSPALHRHTRSGSAAVGAKRSQHTKAAAARLAQVMSTQQPGDSDDDEDDLDLCDYNPGTASTGLGLVGSRPAARPRSPLTSARTSTDQTGPGRPGLGVRSSYSAGSNAGSVEKISPARPVPIIRPSFNTAELVGSPYGRSSPSPAGGRTPSAYSVPGNRSFRSTNMAEPLVSPVDLSTEPVPISKTMPSLRSFKSNSTDQPNSATSIGVGRPSVGIKPVKMVPSVVPVTLKAASSKNKDELDMLQEENESLLEKLRLAEERCEEAEERNRQLEQQIANQGDGGDGVALDAKLLIRKDAATDPEFKSLRLMAQRMILTQEEMEEVVLKRCWLARYWCLCVRHGIHAEIASARYEYWSAFAPLPVEVVLATAERAKEESGVSNDAEEREKKLQKKDALSGEGNVENMLLVDKGLKELTSLKVEEALVMAMAQKRRAAAAASAQTDELKLPIEGKNYSEGFELTEEEQEDVRFKQAWLAYFWRRVKTHGLEPDIADERLQYWIDRMSKSPISNDAVDVDRGLTELKKLAIEIKLWEKSRLSVHRDSDKKTLLDFDS